MLWISIGVLLSAYLLAKDRIHNHLKRKIHEVRKRFLKKKKKKSKVVSLNAYRKKQRRYKPAQYNSHQKESMKRMFQEADIPSEGEHSK
ncbi:hypothetical protein DNHGIG_36520 [Collibacillus ludicampi]|uniref:Uncharacterized protein n=1 Tax=Collibacillus ludicampi TaxID=2771369 RepID=A0AAV4LKH8_9BACL|nr:hypothetical protein [Collibacillus ludicampi]GIM48103.1 hypothetical protein DNHGIG_36520 [Collibacillus ludicampi]